MSMAELIALGMVKTGEDIAMGNPQPSPKHDLPFFNYLASIQGGVCEHTETAKE